MKKIAVVGAGISGLIAAYELKKSGFEVTVFEKLDFFGGRMSTHRKNGLYFDRGANFLVFGYKNLRRYAEELGIANEIEKEEEGIQGIVKNGKIRSIYLEGAKDVLRFKPLGLWSRMKLLWFFAKIHMQNKGLDFFDLSTAKEYDDENAYDYFAREVSQEAADFLADPFTRCMQFHSCKFISRGALLALLNIMGQGDDTFYMCNFLNGMSTLPEKISDEINIKTNSEVSKIEDKNGIKWLNFKNGSALPFDLVLIGAPANIAAKLIDDDRKEILEKVQYAKTVNCSFKIPKGALNDLKCIYFPYSESKIISEFTNEAMKHIGNEKYTLVNIGLHEEAATDLIKMKNDQIFTTVSQEMKKFFPELKMEPYSLQRWPEAMPKFDKGHINRMIELNKRQGENGIYFTGDYINSPWVEGAIKCGNKISKKIISLHSS